MISLMHISNFNVHKFVILKKYSNQEIKIINIFFSQVRCLSNLALYENNVSNNLKILNSFISKTL